ncbi:MAG TPA: hypothetical protein VFN40_08085, partial [Gemmatimonadales bacterium]|nr:hypothetical protein [Gemmatimonadales bacterium]
MSSSPQAERCRGADRQGARPGLAVAVAGLMVAGCAVGPKYHEPGVAPAGTSVGVSTRDTALRSFYDSLAIAADSVEAAGPTDSTGVGFPAPAPRRAPVLVADSTDLAWLEVLRDTTLVGLVRSAVREN